MSAAFRKQTLQQVRSAPKSHVVSIDAGFVQLRAYAPRLLQASSPTVAELITDNASAGADSVAGRLLQENSRVVSVAVPSLPEQVQVEHNTALFAESPLWPVFQRIRGYDAETLVVSGQPEGSEVQAALETYKILLQSVQHDAEHRTVLVIGNKELLGGWKASYDEAETGDQPFSKWEQEQVVFSAHGRNVVSAIIAHAKLSPALG